GESHPNVRGTIVSSIEAGVLQENGLTDEGKQQAIAAGRELQTLLQGAGVLPENTILLTSPFSRARETAEALQTCIGCEMRVDNDLRERWFGSLEGHLNDRYAEVWAEDARNAAAAPHGAESSAAVAARMAASLRRARKETELRQRHYSGEGLPFAAGPAALVLVSHGDALQILQCALAGADLRDHRRLPHLGNAEVRKLRLAVPGREEAAVTGAGAANGAATAA
ncbi:unnamed protein product, partial [Phaeothamnion confervicola]